jgi:predicted nucleic acid-binding protein
VIEDHTDRALALYNATVDIGESFVAPSLMLFELTNIVRKRMREPGALSMGEGRALLTRMLAFPIEILSPPGMHQLALGIADAYGLPAAYDAHYVALAQHQNYVFWTADRRLVRQVQPGLPFVRWIGDYMVAP